MAGLNLDDILSDFEGKSKAAPKSGLDIDAILSDFSPKAEAIPAEVKRVIVNTDPKPPISGISKESSDELNATRAEVKGTKNNTRPLPTTSIQESMADSWIAARDLLGDAATDAQSGHPYKAFGKGILGLVGGATSAATGAVEGSVSKLGNELFGKPNPVTPTGLAGNPTGPEYQPTGIGDRAGVVAGSAIPLDMGLNAANKVAGGLPYLNKLSTYSKNKSLSSLVESIGPENLPSVVARMKENPRLNPADLSAKVKQDTQHLFANDGPQIDYLSKTSGDRMASRKGAIEDAYDTSAGVSVDLAKKVDDLVQSAKKIGSDQINPLVKSAKPVDVTGTIANIDAILKPGIMSKISEGSTLALPEVKQALAAAKTWLSNGKELRTGAEDLHDIQKALRRQGYALTKSGNSGEREIGHALLKVRNDLVADIDKASPGYSKALANYRDEMHISDAFKEGYDGLFASSKSMENTPSFVKKWFTGLSEAEQQAAREGARASIATEIGVSRNPALAGESLSRSDFNKEKMEILFGKEEATKLIKALEDERLIADTHNKIVEGSQTAMRMASKEKFKLPSPTEVMKSAPAIAASEASNFFIGGYPGVGTTILGAAKVGATIKDKVKMTLAREHNAQYAKKAMPVEGPERDELIRQLEAHIPGPKQSLVTRGAQSLSRLVSP